MDVALDDRTRLEIRRVFEAPVAAVYAAWTDPQAIAQWMGPSDDYGPAQASVDLRVGGRYRIVMPAPGGEMHRVGGVFREIVPGRKLVYSWAWESTPERESEVTVEFLPSRDGCEIVLTHRRFFDSDARDRHGRGWNGCLARLARHLSRVPHH